MVDLCGTNDGAEGGVGFGAPLAAEPIGDFAEDHTGTQVPLGHIVGVRHAAVGDEHEQMTAVGGDALRSLRPGSVPGLDPGIGTAAMIRSSRRSRSA